MPGVFGCRAGQRVHRHIGQPLCNKGFQTLEAGFWLLQQQVLVVHVVEAQGSGAASGYVVVRQLVLGLAVGQPFPKELEFPVQPLGHARGAAASAIVRDLDPRGMLDDTTRVELREFVRNAANEMPGVIATG